MAAVTRENALVVTWAANHSLSRNDDISAVTMKKAVDVGRAA